MPNSDIDLWLPALFTNLAVGRSLVRKGLLSKDEIVNELYLLEIRRTDPVIAKAIIDAETVVQRW
jgi:hypothetical protein